MLDNYDSFVYNLASYFLELNAVVIVKQPDNISIKEIEDLHVQGIVISPGPGRPENASFSLEVLDAFQDKMPILGVCLGHQVICHYFGAKVQKGIRPMHGKISSITHNEQGLFESIKSPLNVTRYHSLCVAKKDVSLALSLDAFSEDDVVMAISHKEKPIYGLQFHPEALLTEHGHDMLQNFIKICENHQRLNQKNFLCK
ncbi:MAG: anthranilate synthase component II [Treponema sp.]